MKTPRRPRAGLKRRNAARSWLPVMGRTPGTAAAWWIAQCRNSASSTSSLIMPAYQMTYSDVEESSDEEWDHTFRTNIYSMFYLTKAAAVQMKPGAAIVNTASIHSKMPSPQLLACATTKGAIANYTAGLAQLLAEKGIQVNCTAPGPIWTPLIPSTMVPDEVEHFG